MKKILTPLALCMAVLFFSCQKNDDTAPAGNPGAFSYKSLAVKDTTLAIAAITQVTATAAGSNLRYEWSASFGTIIGSGPQVQWTVCHSDRFRITCKVSDDQGHSESKDVYVHVVP